MILLVDFHYNAVEKMYVRIYFGLRFRVGIYQFETPAPPAPPSANKSPLNLLSENLHHSNVGSQVMLFLETSQWELVFVVVLGFRLLAVES